MKEYKKEYQFECRGEWFTVDEQGHINGFENWIFLGVSFHHWRNGIDVSLQEIFNGENATGGLVWDKDHGTTRTWGGQWSGKLPRITGEWKTSSWK
jgi:hypothetical protein